MRYSFEVRCLSCGSDELEPGPGEHDEKLARSHARCTDCGNDYRLTLTMIPLPDAQRLPI